MKIDTNNDNNYKLIERTIDMNNEPIKVKVDINNNDNSNNDNTVLKTLKNMSLEISELLYKWNNTETEYNELQNVKADIDTSINNIVNDIRNRAI